MQVGNTVANGHAFDRNMKPVYEAGRHRPERDRTKRGKHAAATMDWPDGQAAYASMETSTITPGSILMLVICLTMSVEEVRSMRRL
jgi:hypothetical protein